MLNCNQPNCKNHRTCNLKEPTTQYTQEIQYWLKELKKAKKRIYDYRETVKEIQQHKYSIPINVYGHIEYAPQQNAFGVFIKRPEHVYYGWNYNNLNKIVEEITERIRELRMKELREES